MKIVYVYPLLVCQAGTERVLIDKMNYLSEYYDYEVYLITIEQGKHPLSYPLSSRVKHIDLGIRFSPLYKLDQFSRFLKWQQNNRTLRKQFNDLMIEVKPDIIVATTYHSNLLSVVGDCPVNCIRILESHIDKRYILNNDPYNKKSILRWLNTYSQMKLIDRKARKFDLLVALMDSDAHDWSKYVKTTVIKNVVHLNPTGKICDYSSKHVIFVGRYKEQKGVLDLLDIWKLVYPKHPDWHLDLYGSGYLRDKLLKEADRLHMNIHVNEPTTDVFGKYLSSSIFVLTSIFEPFGLVMPEAMSCGVPVVAFDCPSGPAEIIDNEKTGYLVLNRDKNVFAERLDQLMNSRELRERLGKAAMDSSMRFAPDNIMPIWKNLFETLIASGH